MKAIKKYKINNDSYIGIVMAEDWFPVHKMLPFIQKTDFIVCKWFNFKDSLNDHIEGRTTIAICRIKADAMVVFNRHKLLYNGSKIRMEKLKKKTPKK